MLNFIAELQKLIAIYFFYRPGTIGAAKWRRTAPHDEAKRIVVAFGDASFSPTMKRCRSGVSRLVFRLGYLTVIKVPEFRSSKVCSMWDIISR